MRTDSRCILGFLVAVVVLPNMRADLCQPLPIGIQKCYMMIDIDLLKDLRLPSLLEMPKVYIKSCGEQEVFLSCYRRLLVLCPTYQEFNPVMLDYISVKSLTQGICDHIDVYEDGMECAVKMSRLFHHYMASCLPDIYFTFAAESVTTGNWTKLCQTFDDQYQCVRVLLNAFRCGEQFETMIRHYLYTLQPRQCRDGSEKFSWITNYGLAGAAEKNGVIIGILMFCLFLTRLVLNV